MAKVRSMTGFAHDTPDITSGSLEIIIKSVNSRFLEIDTQLSDGLRALEGEISDKLRRSIVRGKVSFCINYTPNLNTLEYIDKDRLKVLSNLLEQAESGLYNQETKVRFVSGTVDVMSMLSYPGLVKGGEFHYERDHDSVMQAIDKVITDFKRCRETEGERLANAVLERISKIEEILQKVALVIESSVVKERERIENKIKLLKVEVDENRLAAEVAIACQKADIAEEYDRMRCHLERVRDLINGKGRDPFTESIGKHLDFLMQELLREANTMGSKVTTLEMSNIAIEMKVLIEQMREQVQNIE